MRQKRAKVIRQEFFGKVKPKEMSASMRRDYRAVKRLWGKGGRANE